MPQPSDRVCPWWMGYMLLFPWRKYYHNPQTLLESYVQSGMKVMDFGCAMGFFSLPLARLTGDQGRVFCADIQEKMIAGLIKRARKAGLLDRIEPRLLRDLQELQDLKDTIDLVLLFAVVHEVSDKITLFDMMGHIVKSGGQILFAEPRGHVTEGVFRASLDLAAQAGFIQSTNLRVNGSHAALLKKA